MINKIILASKSGVRKKILSENGIECEVIPANVDEDLVDVQDAQDPVHLVLTCTGCERHT